MASTARELATNLGLVERLAAIAETFGRPLASPARARELLGLGPVTASDEFTVSGSGAEALAR